mmetsp:Transcript_18768/g.55924  ORF Transcript_18768/g.55924 Transcript_18768/m.55924 type:complete len:101 (-) Transcript_18768:128-430(-)
MSTIAAAEARSLFRAFLRGGRTFPYYNIKEYILRRAREGFREGALAKDPAEAAKLLTLARDELAVMKRQSIVYGLYERPIKNVLEIEMEKRSPPAGSRTL